MSKTAPTGTADIVIAGADLIGGTLACALAEAGLNVVVLDTDIPSGSARDGRANMISPPGRRLLEMIGLWAEVSEEAGEIREIRVVNGDSPLLLQSPPQDAEEEVPGWVIENRVIRRAIQRRLDHLPSATLLASARVGTLHRDAAAARLTLTDGRALTARLVVAADGSDSPVRIQAGIDVTRWEHGRNAITCVIAHEHPHEGMACQRFLPAGFLTVLPLAGNHSAIVWSEPPRRIAALMDLDDGAFLTELILRIGDYLGEVYLAGPRHAEPQVSQLAAACVSQRVALVGDAAYTMPLLSDQVPDMGLRDVAALAETLVDAARLGFDVGDAAVLSRFQTWRRFDNTATLLLNEGLARLFSSSAAPIQAIRDIGLALVNGLGPLKKPLLRRAMGAMGEVPKLMRGETL